MALIFWVVGLVMVLQGLNKLSYHYFKNKTLRRQKWDLNICCGKTDGGGVNADIVMHKAIPNLVLIKDIYHLPFKDKRFKSVLCSHTIEHVDKPKEFYRELKRVGEKVTLVTPPLWDLWAALNLRQHKWVVLSFKKEHDRLPKMVPYALGQWYQRKFGSKIAA